MRVVAYFFRTYPWHTLVVLLCLVVASVFEGIGLSALLPVLTITTQGVDGEVEAGNSPLEAKALEIFDWIGLPPSIGPLLAVIGVAFTLKAAFMILANRQVGYTVAHVATHMRLSLLRALLTTRWSYYTRQPVGAVANAMASEAGRASSAYEYMTQGISYGIVVLLYSGVALGVSWRATLGAAVAGLITSVLLSALVRMAYRAGARQTKLLRSLLSRLTDALGAVKLLKATHREDLVGPLLEKDTRKLNRALQRKVLSKEALKAVQEWVLVLCGIGGLWIATQYWRMDLTAIFILVLLFSETLAASHKLQRKYQSMLTESSGLWSLLDLIGRAESQKEMLGGSATPSLERGLALRGVGVHYDALEVLNDLDLEVPAGSITAIIGPSGSGKTTIVDLITGLLRPDAGEVWIDGVPLAEVDLAHWRLSIGYVPQESLMLSDSVRVNVTLGNPAMGDAEVERALRDADAWEFVSRLPEGIDADVGERGTLLSGGQRQRIAIARALVAGPRLLILDEATAALDPESERAVWETVSKLRGKTTVVAISHQPALMAVADRVYRIEAGRARLDTSRGDPAREVARFARAF